MHIESYIIFKYDSENLEHLIFAINYSSIKCANMESFIFKLISWIITNARTNHFTLKEILSAAKLVIN